VPSKHPELSECTTYGSTPQLTQGSRKNLGCPATARLHGTLASDEDKVNGREPLMGQPQLVLLYRMACQAHAEQYQWNLFAG